MTYDAGNKRHVDLLSRHSKLEEEANRTVINSLMGMANGRAYIHDLLVYCNVFTQPFSADSHLTAFGCGQLDVGQVLFRAIMRWCPEQYTLMMREANARSSTTDARLSRSDKDANGRDSDEPEPYVHPGSGNDSPTASDSDEERGYGRTGEE